MNGAAQPIPAACHMLSSHVPQQELPPNSSNPHLPGTLPAPVLAHAGVCRLVWSVLHLIWLFYTSVGVGAYLSLTNPTMQPTLLLVVTTACPARLTSSPGPHVHW